MVTEEVKKDKKEHPEELHHYTGACRFCGQMAELETIFPWTEDECHDAATEKCTCLSAKVWTRRRQNKKKAIERIEEKFSNAEEETFLKEEIRDFLKMAAEQVAEERVDKAVVNVGRIKVTISETKKGGIKIECVVTKKEAEEV